jgi:outer membrane usher protein FimD/PapC
MVNAMEKQTKMPEGHSVPRLIAVCISLALMPCVTNVYGAGQEIEFNTAVLDSDDQANIDLSHFSRSGYIMPGTYSMVVHVNKSVLPEQQVTFYTPDDDPKGSEACLSPALVGQLGLKPQYSDALTWLRGGECLRRDSLPGVEILADLGKSALYISVPQAYLEYTAENWDPPSRWDDGIPGILFDYNVNARTQKQQAQGKDSYNLSGNGTAGANMGPWRLRADWQARLDHTTGSGNGSQEKFEWSRYYAYRALPLLRSQLTLGENYLNSGMFDSFRFMGASLNSDDNMLPPNLRGYAPEVTGVAKTNAKVTISQQGRVLYETQVAAGPFRIQDINDAVSGELDVRVEEQDGSEQTFTVNTANIPYLTRPGSVRFKTAVGRPDDTDHSVNGPLFATGEFSWGVSNGWSLYGGALTSSDYTALSSGIGRDLMVLGAISFDVTQSLAKIPQEDETLSGRSYRVSYSKRFEELDSQVTFAGYRFSEREFMSMSEFLEARRSDDYTRGGGSKEMYTISLSKSFRDWGLSGYLNYNHQTYWDKADTERYSLMLSKTFDVGDWRNISMSLSAYRNQNNGITDDGAYLSVSVPWGNSGRVGYNATVNRDDVTQYASYYDRLNDRDTYQVSGGSSRSGVNVSGFLTHEGDQAKVNANASYQEGRYSSLALSAQGGMTLTPEGGALHRTGINGGTRMLLDTNGVADVPVKGNGSNTASNMFGKAVVSGVSHYYPSKVRIDLNELGENAEAKTSVVQGTLTEGAIGYRKFEIVGGAKAMAVIRLADGSIPPFGATTMNRHNQETGLVTNDGEVYLSGINTGETMTVNWGGIAQCEIQMPDVLPADLLSRNLLLPCRKL